MMYLMTMLLSSASYAQLSSVQCTNGTADQFECSNVDILSWMTINGLGGDEDTRLNDIWGWTDSETGREYALVGLTDGTAIVNVTDPRQPIFMAKIPTETVSSVWRDIKVYANHALIVADVAGWHGMQIVDLRRIRDIVDPPVELLPDTVYSMFGSAHNVVVNEDTGFAYAVGISVPAFSEALSCGGALHMIDVRQPTEPVFAGCFADDRTGRTRGGVRTGYTHDAQCVIYDGPDERYRGREICIGSNETSISIADVTDKENPTAISFADYPNVGYAHQGWLTEDHRYFLLDDELDELYFSVIDRTRTIIFDVTDLEQPAVLLEHFGESYSIDHNQYVVGDRVFQANYTSGLRILDISNILQPVEVGYFVTYLPQASKNGTYSGALRNFHRCHDDCSPGDVANPDLTFSGAWSVYPFFESGSILVSSIDEGLFVLDATSAISVSALADELPAGKLRLDAYPNPAAADVSVRWSGFSEVNARLELFDARGRKIATIARIDRTDGTLRIDVSNLPAGLYLLRAESTSDSISAPLIVSR